MGENKRAITSHKRYDQTIKVNKKYARQQTNWKHLFGTQYSTNLIPTKYHQSRNSIIQHISTWCDQEQDDSEHASSLGTVIDKSRVITALERDCDEISKMKPPLSCRLVDEQCVSDQISKQPYSLQSHRERA